jgi:Transposase and inactivated derivatives
MERATRKNARLKDYDYSRNGAYFITVCVKDGCEWLWENEPVGARIARPLTSAGKIIETSINEISVRYPMIEVLKYVIMPNHLHMILLINNDGRAMRAPTVSTVINQIKGYVTKQLGYSVWQKLFYDHIIRNEADYLRIWKYIDENPLKWEDDKYFSESNGIQSVLPR